MLLQYFTIIIIYFISMAVPLMDFSRAIELECQGAVSERAGIRTKPQRTADILDTDLVFHDMDDRMVRVGF